MDDTIPSFDPRRNLVPKTAFIYVLIDPRDDAVRYVGKANDPKVRLDRHLRDKRDTHKQRWINVLKSLELKPIMQVIEEVPYDLWAERECYWIEYYRSQGCNLTNSTEGGKGGEFTPEVIAKISEAAKNRKRPPYTEEWRRNLGNATRGKKQSPEHVAKRAAARKGSKHSPETRAKLSAAKLGKPLSPEAKAKNIAAHANPEFREKLAAAHRGKKATPETKAKLSVAGRGRQVSPETREKLAAANRGKKRPNVTPNKGKSLSKETRAKISASLTGRKLSPESIEKRSAAVRGTKRSPETRAKISAAKTGVKRKPFHRDNGRRGKPLSAEVKTKMIATKKRNRMLKLYPPDAPTLF
jgi:hypothetical protein